MDLQIKAYLVAAFTQNGHGGSPTGIVPDAGGLDDIVMQQLARIIPASQAVGGASRNSACGCKTIRQPDGNRYWRHG